MPVISYSNSAIHHTRGERGRRKESGEREGGGERGKRRKERGDGER